MWNKILKWAIYCQKLGTWKGTSLIFKLAITPKNTIIEIKISGIQHPIYLRSKTSDEYVFRSIFIEEQYQLESVFLPQTIIDGGANIGLAAVYFIHQYPKAKIVCIEPEPQNLVVLQKNIQHYPHISVVSKALWSHATQIVIENNGLDNWGFTVREVASPSSETIPTTSINEVLNSIENPGVLLLKIDIEGSEKKVLEAEDSATWLQACDVLIIELHDRMQQGTAKALVNAIAPRQFNMEQKADHLICTFQDKE